MQQFGIHGVFVSNIKHLFDHMSCSGTKLSHLYTDLYKVTTLFLNSYKFLCKKLANSVEMMYGIVELERYFARAQDPI